MIEVDDGRVIAFSITITDRRMYYNTKLLTRGFIKVSLGKDAFSEPGIHCDGEQMWIAAYRYGYARTYYLGRPGAYLRFILSHNMSGTGQFDTQRSAVNGEVETGAFSRSHLPLNLTVDATGITINTLTVIHPEAPDQQFLARNIHGPDESQVKMATFIKSPSDATLRNKLQFRWYQVKTKANKILSRN